MYDPSAPGAPALSVVMPVYNAAAFLAAAVASVQAQSWQDWELILVEDGSSDASPQLLRALAAADPRLHVLHSGGNRGAGVARNLAMDAARGRYLAFLDADDLWHPQKLAWHLQFLAARPAALSFTAYLRRDEGGAALEEIGVPPEIGYRQLLSTNVIGCSTVILDRQLLGEPRMPALRLRQDFACWLHILRQTEATLGPAAGVPLALTTYTRRRAASVSARKSTAAAATWRLYRGEIGLSLPQALTSFARYGLRGLLRHHAPQLARRLGYLQAAILPDSPQAQSWRAGLLPGKGRHKALAKAD
jgi:teichuronic acid biosynthesis glycosyltransferase TuaG